MIFEWDAVKNKINIKKHGIDFNDAKLIFDGLTLTVEDDRFDYSEKRYITFGLLIEQVISVVHTESVKKISIISARKATKNEQKEYFKQVSY
jgi:uncharacterized DUF497 family protein